jgi:hypothetical protein
MQKKTVSVHNVALLISILRYYILTNNLKSLKKNTSTNDILISITRVFQIDFLRPRLYENIKPPLVIKLITGKKLN